jgi:hypothetical protein
MLELVLLRGQVPPFSLNRQPAGFLICKNILPVPSDFALRLYGRADRIGQSLEKGGAARATPPESEARATAHGQCNSVD